MTLVSTSPHAPSPDRVRANTHPEVNDRIDRLAEARVRSAAAKRDLTSHLDHLGREWDFERVIEAEASVTGLAGLLLGVTVDRRFLVVPGFVAAMMLLHAVQGSYPLLPVLRRLGVRTVDEIERERYAVKALRGDFAPVRDAAGEERAAAAWRAVHA